MRHLLLLFLVPALLTSAYGQEMVDDEAVKARRLLLCARTRTVLKTGLELLGITPLERM